MEDTTLPEFVMFREMVEGAGCVGCQEKEWMRCFLDDLRAFGIHADQWTNAAQDEGEWHRTFHGKMDLCRERQGLTLVCPNVPDQEDSPKQAGSCWFARPC